MPAKKATDTEAASPVAARAAVLAAVGMVLASNSGETSVELGRNLPPERGDGLAMLRTLFAPCAVIGNAPKPWTH